MLNPPIQKNPAKLSAALRGDSVGPHIILDLFRANGIAVWKAIKATGTFTLTVVPSNNETVTINGRIYTFKTALTPAAGEVLIGGSLANAQANLVAAVNGNNLLAGSSYASATRPNTDVSMSAFSANVATFTALQAGTTGNAITLAEACANGSVSGATLTGGLNESQGDGVIKPYDISYNTTHPSSTSASGIRSFYQDGGEPQKHIQEMGSTYDDLRYATTASKKYSALNYFGLNYKRFVKVGLISLLAENGAAFGLNPASGRGGYLNGELDTNKFVISDGSTGIQVIQIGADGAITVGTLFTHTQAIQRFACVDTTKILGLRNIGATSYGLMTFTVSGTTISFGSESTVTVTGSGTNQNMDIIKIATGKAAFSYRNNTTTYGLRIADFTGAITITASDTIVTPPTVTTQLKLMTYDIDKFVCFGGSGSVANCRLFAVNVTGTAISIGSAYTPIVPWTLDTDNSTSFASFPVNTTNVLWYGVNAAVGQKVFEQVSIATLTISAATTIGMDHISTQQFSNPLFIKIATDRWGLMFSGISGMPSRWTNQQGMILFTVSGSTVTMQNFMRRFYNIYGNVVSGETYRHIKVGTTFVTFLHTTAATINPVQVFKPIVVEVYNHETLMLSQTITDPWVENIYDLVGLSNVDINDTKAYLKIKNTDGQNNAIKVNKVLVEMEG